VCEERFRAVNAFSTINHNKLLPFVIVADGRMDDGRRFRLVFVCYSGSERRNLYLTLKMGLGTKEGVRREIPCS
jgi:hypothetical protein